MINNYLEWEKVIFDHSPDKEYWYYDIDYDEEILKFDDISKYIIELCEECEELINKYTDDQINNGLWYLFSEAGSKWFSEILNGKNDMESSIRCIEKLEYIYRKLFYYKCTKTLSHKNQLPDNPINAICYMLWDIAPPVEDNMITPVVALLSNILSLDHIAIQEGAIHGLGHLGERYGDVAINEIKKFIDYNNNISEDLRLYAERAIRGNLL
jgi:hypothetical protein